MKKTAICLFLFLLLMTSCNHKDKVRSCEYSSVVFNLDDTPISDKAELYDYELIPLDSNPKCLLSSIEKMIVTPKGIYVQDTRYNHSLFLFGHDGKFISKIGVQGHSKSEYVRINNFTPSETGDTVAILDDYGRTIKVYSFTGKFLYSFSFEDEYGWDDCISVDNHFYMTSYHHGREEIFSKYDYNFKKQTKLGTFDSSLISGAGYFSKYTQYSSKYICFLDYYNSCFYLVDRNNEDRIIKLVIESSNILSPNKKEYDSYPYDKIMDYILTENGIFMHVDYQGYLCKYRIDIDNKTIWKDQTSGINHSFMDYYKGSYYEYLTAQQIENLVKICKNDINLMKALTPYVDSLSDENNYYILKAKPIHEIQN